MRTESKDDNEFAIPTPRLPRLLKLPAIRDIVSDFQLDRPRLIHPNEIGYLSRRTGLEYFPASAHQEQANQTERLKSEQT
jgi:hypothetical protein